MDKGVSREELLAEFAKHKNIRFISEKPRLTFMIHTKWNDLQSFPKPFSNECPYCKQPLVSCLRHYSITPSPAEANTSELPKVAKEQDNGS